MSFSFSPSADVDGLGTLIDQLIAQRVPARIWDRDHTVWKPDPEEIANRLGWLDIADRMADSVPAINAFGERVRIGTDRVVLMGMGGSSLAPEALHEVFGDSERRPAPRRFSTPPIPT